MRVLRLESWEINPEKWDECVSSSQNPRLSGLYVYLNNCASSWEGMVEMCGDEYLSVFPIQYRTKLFMRHVYQSPYVKFQDVYSKRTVSLLYKQQFVEQALKPYRQISNFCFPARLDIKNVTSLPVKNFVLRIDNYGLARERYSQNRVRCLRRALNLNISIVESREIEALFRIWQVHVFPKVRGLQENQIEQLRNLYGTLLDYTKSRVYYAIDHNGDIIGGMFIGVLHPKITYLMSASTEQGRNANAMSVLVDHMIRKYADEGFLELDFNGGGISGIDQFFRSFGADEEIYWRSNSIGSIWNQVLSPLQSKL